MLSFFAFSQNWDQMLKNFNLKEPAGSLKKFDNISQRGKLLKVICAKKSGVRMTVVLKPVKN